MNYSKELKNQIFNIIQKESDKLKYPTYVVGGWVRDLLLKRDNSITDIDFVCIGSGIILAEKVALKIGKQARFKVFKKFVTVKLLMF